MAKIAQIAKIAQVADLNCQFKATPTAKELMDHFVEIAESIKEDEINNFFSK